MGTWTLRPAAAGDAPFLERMLYEALYVHDGEDPFPMSTLDEPAIRHYVADFGAWPGDIGVIGLCDDSPLGACWLRVFTSDDPGYGWVADDVPELSIAVIEHERAHGLGRLLIEAAAAEAAAQGIERISLSVDARSPARRLYERLGFEPAGRDDTSITMVRSI